MYPVVTNNPMNGQMWKAPAVQRNVDQLVRDGVTVIGPDEGWLSCRERGYGRMADVSSILEAIQG